MAPKTKPDLRLKLRADYDLIAEHFSETRNAPWPEFHFFRSYLKAQDALLDLGCGNGRVFDFLEQSGVNIDYTGYDFSEKLLAQGKKKHPKAHFMLGDMAELPFADNSFDQVWAIASFHHLPTADLRQKCLKQIKRVLKPGGYLVMTCWNLWQAKYRFAFLKNWKNLLNLHREGFADLAIPWKDQQGRVLAERYYHAFTPRSLRKYLKEAGFEIVSEFYSLNEKKVRFLESRNICFVARKSL